MGRYWWCIALLAGCSGADSKEGDAKACGRADEAAVVTQLTFTRAEDDISYGFDLDGHDTTLGDFEGCGIGDFVAPDGTGGIDNAFARLLPVLELTEAVAVEALVQDAINSGELMMMLEFDGLDDRDDDDCVDFTLSRGEGVPFVGSHDRIDAGQTFDRDADVRASEAGQVELVDGQLRAHGLDVDLPIQVFDVMVPLVVENASIHIDLHADGTYSGYMGGGIDPDPIIEMAFENPVDQDLAESLPGLFASASDLADESGECRYMSATLDFEGVSAYFYDD